MNSISQVYNKIIVISSICLGLSLTTPVFSEDFTSGVFGFQQKLAEGGNPQAQYKLGTMYETGRGIGKDSNKALDWYKKAAAQNYKSAEDRITYLEINKTGFNAARHNDWLNSLHQRAKAGNGEALMLLGSVYKNGIGVKQDLTRAQELFGQAATKDIAGSETELEATNTLIRTQEMKQAQQQKSASEENRRRQVAEQQAAERQALANKNNEQRMAQKKVADEQKRIQLERQRLEAEKHQLEQQKRELARQQQQKQQQAMQQKPADVAPEEPEVFQKDVCKGKKARFLTVCQ